MAVQIVMDRAGDSRYPFDPASAAQVAEAELRFQQLTARGFTATARVAPGRVEIIRSFDPRVEEYVFFPRLVGG
ncbi:conserved hypothetical protein [Bradyrhizobium sp. ORS 375]|uniref:hypothetical protein n=1 Tax=Bradyrhizobium sp. (strain ORS 375) TaxID=566679 RepID=UPI0002406312|nr:hypothetical protein [Bradyrhizobium sp. ORS 375]CCD91862.1 conserved hypothetical protein [Bradyrhizobium sp. ORS 375]